MKKTKSAKEGKGGDTPARLIDARIAALAKEKMANAPRKAEALVQEPAIAAPGGPPPVV